MRVAYKYCFAESLRIIDWFACGYRQLFYEVFVIQAEMTSMFFSLSLESSVAIYQLLLFFNQVTVTVFDTKPACRFL